MVRKLKTIDKRTATNWAGIEPLLVIRNERQYRQAICRLNELLDEIDDDESHPLFGLLDTLGTVIHAYEEQHHHLPKPSAREFLRGLMEDHGLSQADLRDIGSQGVVSEILSGRRALNARQIGLLAKRFHVSPALFFD